MAKSSVAALQLPPRIIERKAPRTPRHKFEFDGSKLSSPLLSYFCSSSSGSVTGKHVTVGPGTANALDRPLNFHPFRVNWLRTAIGTIAESLERNGDVTHVDRGED